MRVCCIESLIRQNHHHVRMVKVNKSYSGSRVEALCIDIQVPATHLFRILFQTKLANQSG